MLGPAVPLLVVGVTCMLAVLAASANVAKQLPMPWTKGFAEGGWDIAFTQTQHTQQRWLLTYGTNNTHHVVQVDLLPTPKVTTSIDVTHAMRNCSYPDATVAGVWRATDILQLMVPCFGPNPTPPHLLMVLSVNVASKTVVESKVTYPWGLNFGRFSQALIWTDNQTLWTSLSGEGSYRLNLQTGDELGPVAPGSNHYNDWPVGLQLYVRPSDGALFATDVLNIYSLQNRSSLLCTSYRLFTNGQRLMDDVIFGQHLLVRPAYNATQGAGVVKDTHARQPHGRRQRHCVATPTQALPGAHMQMFNLEPPNFPSIGPKLPLQPSCAPYLWEKLDVRLLVLCSGQVNTVYRVVINGATWKLQEQPVGTFSADYVDNSYVVEGTPATLVLFTSNEVGNQTAFMLPLQ